MKKLLIIFACLGLIGFAHAAGEAELLVKNFCGKTITIQQSPAGLATGGVREQLIPFGGTGMFLVSPNTAYTFCHTQTNSCCRIGERENQVRQITFSGSNCLCKRG